MDTVYQLPACELLQQLGDGSVDLIVTDPPYGIGYKSGVRQGNGGQPRSTSASFGEDVLQTDWLGDAYRVLVEGGAMYLFTRWDVMGTWITAIKAAGFKVVQRLVWDKRNRGAGNLDYYGSQTEDILFCVKGNHRLRYAQREGNLISITKMDTINNEGNYDNPTQKPESIMRRLILNSSDPGDVVLDPFCGTGTVGAAARTLGRHYLIGDRDAHQYEIAKARLEEPYQMAWEITA